MTTRNKPKAFFTLNLPRRPKQGDVIFIKGNLREDPELFKVILGVRVANDRNSSLEPSMVALEFKTVFHGDDIQVTTNWKTDTGWQDEELLDSDWIDKRGKVILTLLFENNSVVIKDGGNSVITNFPLKFEADKINRVQLWGNIAQMKEVTLKYNQRRAKL